MKTLPLTVLLHEGPMARAYLEGLHAIGMRPERIIKLVYARHPATGKLMGRWLFGGLRIRYAEAAQDQALYFWPRKLLKRHAGWISAIAAEMTRLTGLPETVSLMADGSAPLSKYADHVETIHIDGFKDPALAERLRKLAPGVVLFTGGGLLPGNIVSIPNLPVLHVHPGIVPHIRGADCLLWSMLIRGRPGVSLFVMAPGLDTGDVIETQEFEPAALPAPPDEADEGTIYRAVYSFCDPVFRAKALNDFVLGNPTLDRLNGTPQRTDVGVTYHFMHEKLRRHAWSRLFEGALVA